VLAIAGLLLLAAIITAWAKFARQDLPLLQLLAVPLYILWKIPLYLTFLFKPQTNWIRTKRNTST
jgi:FtsH-binding integral membrane protein